MKTIIMWFALTACVMLSTMAEEGKTRAVGCHYGCKTKCDGDSGCLSECLEGCSNPRLQRHMGAAMNVASKCRAPCDEKCAGEPRSCNLECYEEKGCSLAFGKRESTPGIGCHYDCKNKCDGDLGCLSECLEGCSNPRLQRHMGAAMNVASKCRAPCDEKCAGEPRSCNLECYEEKGCSLAFGKREATRGVGCHYECQNKCGSEWWWNNSKCVSKCLEGCNNPRLQRYIGSAVTAASRCRGSCDSKCAGEPNSCNLECYEEKGCSLPVGK